MDKLFNVLRNGNIEQKLVLFPQLLQSGEEGINYLIDCLGDRANTKQKLKVQQLLEELDLDTEETRKAISKEIAIDSVFDLAESNNSEATNKPNDEYTEYLLDDTPF